MRKNEWGSKRGAVVGWGQVRFGPSLPRPCDSRVTWSPRPPDSHTTHYSSFELTPLVHSVTSSPESDFYAYFCVILYPLF